LLGLTAAVARRMCGTWGDVLAAAVPPRHARAERSVLGDGPRLPSPMPLPVAPLDAVVAAGLSPPHSSSAWREFLAGLGSAPRAEGPVRGALALPTSWDWTAPLVAAAAHTRAAGRRSLVVVPDDRELRSAVAALGQLPGGPKVVALAAGAGPQARYSAYLRTVAGQADFVVGTRTAAFAPVPDLGLIWVWQESDGLMTDPQAPYWHVRDVAGLRSLGVPGGPPAAGRPALVFAARTRSPEIQRLVDQRWLTELSPLRHVWRSGGPRIQTVGESAQDRDAVALVARLPGLAFETARRGLAQGSVLVQVPRKGYLPMIACAECRELARCPACGRAMSMPGPGLPVQCANCGPQAEPWSCTECGGTRVRAVRVGSGRTVAELTAAFPRVPVLRSDSNVGILAEAPSHAALVVATPGAEPAAAGGYAAALLLDGDVLLAAPRLRAAEDALARWTTATAAVRIGGTVLVVADPGAPAVQTLVRADPIGWAQRELVQRAEAGLPPAVRMVALEGPAGAVAQVRAALAERRPDAPAALGPFDLPGESGGRAERAERWLLRMSYAQTPGILDVVAEVQRERSRTKAPVVTVRVDPADLQ
jgi:primosomal protein N' (replication factor Y)